jgi:hypothetical protein
MNEKDLNRIIVRSLQPLGKAHKISDEAANYQTTAKKPFDYFGACGRFIVFGESKFIKGMAAFNFNRLETHQLDSLNAFADAAAAINPQRIITTVSVGFWEPHKFFFVVFLDFDLIRRLRAAGINSIKKKDFQHLAQRDPHALFAVRKQQIENIEQLPQRVVRVFPELI